MVRPSKSPTSVGVKIHQLPDGARFEYEGREYVKTGPMFATGPEGQRLIPKYAVLRPLAAGEPLSALVAGADRDADARALDQFVTACRPLLADGAGQAFDAAVARLRAVLRLSCLLIAALAVTNAVAPVATAEAATAAKDARKPPAKNPKKQAAKSPRKPAVSYASRATKADAGRGARKSTPAGRASQQGHRLPAKITPARTAPLVVPVQTATPALDAARPGNQVCESGGRVFLLADCAQLAKGAAGGRAGE